MGRDMDQVHKYGQMGLSMRVNGSITRPMEEESSGMQTEMSTKVTGKMIRPMDMEFMFM